MTKKIANPLDALFDVPPAEQDDEYLPMTEGALQEIAPATQVEKDAEDLENDRKIDQVYVAALEAFNNQTAFIEAIEPRYAARTAEVAASYLNIALSAATAKAKLKNDRAKTRSFIPYGQPGGGNGNVVASREDILKLLATEAELKKP